MSEAPKTVWVTKYALTSGIVERKLEKVDEDGVAKVVVPGALNNWELYWPRDWRPTREAALAHANEMKAVKIASLKRQIERLESLEFRDDP